MDKIYVVIENSFDYQDIKFYLELEKAKNEFLRNKEDFDDSTSTGGALIEVSGNGGIYSGVEIDGSGDARVLETYDEYSIQEERDELEDEDE